MTKPKKLIEVAMPIKEISAESVRDKSIRHGHISTLHLWWARRPLPVCRAVVFASLVPDPLDPNCPQTFRDAVEILLGKENNPGDPYATYADIPWTSVYDPMEDNLRNRLQMFIGKFTEDMQQHLLGKAKKTETKKMVTNSSLIKWESKNDENIIGKARKLIWVAYNTKENSKVTAKELIADFDAHYKAIKDGEHELYALENRHLKTEKANFLEKKLESAKEAFLNKMPKVFDPFAGGGAIPLEAARLGCRSYGNDINPVAHIIQKGSLEFPQKFGKPITYSKQEFIKLYGKEELVTWCHQNGKHIDTTDLKIEIPNRLTFDVKFYSNKLTT
jgi:putative DNA methylase